VSAPDPILTAGALHSRASLCWQLVLWQAPTCAMTRSCPPLTVSGMNVVQTALSPLSEIVTAKAWQPSWLYEQPATAHSLI
jgi:hypothetical protein